MPIFKLQIRRKTGPTRFFSAVPASFLGMSAVLLFIRAALSFTQFRTAGMIVAAIFLATMGVALYRIWTVYREVYPKAAAGDAEASKALSAVIKAYAWGNVTSLLFAVAVFQASLILKK